MSSQHNRTGEARVRIEITIWCLFLVVCGALTIWYVASTLSEEKRAAAKRHAVLLDPTRTELGKTQAETRRFDLGRAPKNLKVNVGIYVDRISEISIPDSRWLVDFYVWFRWRDQAVQPGEHFQIINGDIVKKILETSYENDGERYELYRVSAEITKFFDATRFPRDDHLLTIRLEDSDHQFFDLLYVPDEKGSSISSRVVIPGFQIYNAKVVERKHSYKTRRGDPRLPEDYKATYSQFVYGIWIKRSGWAPFVKVLFGIMASVAVSLLACFVSAQHTDPRFALGVGGFFAAVASTYIISQKVPENATMGLSDYVTAVSLITILLTLATSALSVHYFNRLNQRALAQKLDRWVFFILSSTYGLFILSVAVVASV